MLVRTALIVGADTPMGSVLARALGARGFEIVCVAQAPGVTMDGFIAGDLSTPSDAALIMDAAAKSLGSAIGVLVNASTYCAPDAPSTVSLEALNLHMAINAHMPIMLTQAFAAQVPDAAKDSVVINVLSGDALSLPSERTSFVLAQTALGAYTKIAAQALAPRTRVNALVPPACCFEEDPVPDAIAQDIERTLGLLLDIQTITGEALVVDNAKIDAWRTPEHP